MMITKTLHMPIRIYFYLSLIVICLVGLIGVATTSSSRAMGEAQKPGITFGASYQHDTSEPLREMAQQSVKAPKAKTARGADSAAILFSGISPDTNGAVGATHRVKLVNKGYQVFDNRTGASLLDS